MAPQGKQLCILAVVLAWCVLPLQAQQSEPQPSKPVQPYPAGSTGKVFGQPADSGADLQSPKDWQPDTRPLTGAEQFTFGWLGSGRNYLVPTIHVRQFSDTNSTRSLGGSTDFESATLISGDLAFQHVGKSAEMTLSYAGGGALYNTNSDLNETFHSVSLSQRLYWRRWSFLLSDSASYLPESAFGYGYVGPWGGFGSGQGGLTGQLSGLNPVFNPNQTILTGRSRRMSNVVVGEVQYSFSPRSSVVASASYGLLHFLDPGFIDNNNAMFRGGYNYLLNRRDSIGFVYGYRRFAFDTTNFRIQSHDIHLAYGRRITGRLAMQLSAGPRVRTFRNDPSNRKAQVSWSAGASVRYQYVRTDLALSYHRGVTGGAGLFFGSSTDDVQGSIGRAFTRNWSGRLNLGFARNDGSAQILLVPTEFQFRSWYVGGDINRALGRRANIHFTYRLQQQHSDASFCLSGNCGTDFVRHRFGIGFDWNFRPLRWD